jgi:hypothetical protein
VVEHSWASWGQADEESVFSEILIMFIVLKCWFVPFCFGYVTILFYIFGSPLSCGAGFHPLASPQQWEEWGRELHPNLVYESIVFIAG